MTFEELKALLLQKRPEEVAKAILERETNTVFPSVEKYTAFRANVQAAFPAEEIFVMGSGNLGYSLNPKKWRWSFRPASDVDTVVISSALHQRYWDELRAYHRTSFYLVDRFERDELRRRGEDVYSGFVSPKFIPSTLHPLRLEHDLALNKLSDELVGYRKVRTLFFRNRAEVYDYYKRSLMQIY